MLQIPCSKLARPMVCAGYSFLDLPKKEDDGRADEGIAAGEYLERKLKNIEIGETDKKGTYFDEDIKFYIDPIYDDIMLRAEGEILAETKIDWQTRSGIWIRGRYDACFVDKNGRLCIEDLKYGWGIVEVEKNWQLLAYAIGEVIRRGQGFNEIKLTIHQPRVHHEDGSSRDWIISYTELLEYKEIIEKRMEDIVNGDRTLTTSKHCKYCEATAEACPAFNRLFYRALEASTEFFQDSLENDEISRQLDQIARAEEVIKIKKDSLIELGTSRIKQGGLIPGYVQEKKYGHRNWKKGLSAEAIHAMTGVDVIEKKLMTPAKAEKAGVSKELVRQISEARFAGMKLVKKDASKIADKVFGSQQPNGGK